jgi:hypothetical protein
MATGRRQVAPGQVIASDWGNVVWDQSVQTFATAADRTTQFPAPKAGATSWLDDVKQLQTYTGTAWKVLYDAAGGSAIPMARAGFVSAAPPGNSFTGWALSAPIADPSGTITIGVDKMTANKAGVYLASMYMTAGSKFSASFTLGGNRLGGAHVEASDFQITLTLTAVLAAGDTITPSFFFFTPVAGTAGGLNTFFNLTRLGYQA